MNWTNGLARGVAAGTANGMAARHSGHGAPAPAAVTTAAFSRLASRRRLFSLALASGALALAGCAAPRLEDHAGQRPVFDLRTYFDGPVTAHGLVSDRAGKVLRRFVVSMRCSWVGDIGTLDEDFVYDDGERERRVWTLRRLGDGRYVGTAADVVGEAVGASVGPAFRWQYTLKLPVSGSIYEVQFDDWMHQIDERTVINRAVMSKFGIRLGEVTLAFRRP